MRKIFIVNPASGNGKAIGIADEIKKLLNHDGELYEMYYTSAPKEATEIAMNFNDSNERCIIYSIGGDGTLFEIVNGMSQSNNILGIIPAGTGNDFVKSIDNDQNITLVDLCKMNQLYFINIASIGIDAEIANNQNKMKGSIIPKSIRYKTSMIKTFFEFNYPHIEAIIDQKEFNQDISLLTICNGKYYGGGFQIAPNAVYDDGKFDIYLADRISKFKMPGILLKIIKGTHDEVSEIHKLESNKVIIHSEKALNCNLDGEIFNLKDMCFSITDRKIPIYTANDKIKQLCKRKGLYH